MQITLVHNDNLITLSVSADTTIQSLLTTLQSEPTLHYNASTQSVALNYAGRIISTETSKTLQQLNIQDNDVIEISIQSKQSTTQQSQPQPQQMSEYEQRAMLEMALLEDALEQDPMNPDLQRRLEEIIKRKNIQANIESAMENNPESFARVIMLYVPMEVNNQKLTAFVDSGAQSTIMSLELAKRCNLEHLIDERFKGMAIGVGSQPIVGRVHSAKVKIGDVVLVCSFTILQESSIDLLLGLDQLKRHAMCINLANNCLELYDKKVEFLSEHQLPKKYRKNDDTEMSDSSSNTSASSATGHALGSSVATSTVSRPTPQAAAAAAALARQQQTKPTTTPATTSNATTTPSNTNTGNTSNMTPQQQVAWLASLMATAARSLPQQTAGTTSTPNTAATSNNRPTPTTTHSTTHSADKIASLVQLGFSEQDAVQALNATNGDVEQAAGLLFSR